MARSVWKGPFVDGYLLKKADTARASGRHEMIRIWSRRSTILPQFVGLTFGVYNGQKHIPVIVTGTSAANSPRRARFTAIHRIARPSVPARPALPPTVAAGPRRRPLRPAARPRLKRS
jgi:ribosomal protein S19